MVRRRNLGYYLAALYHASLKKGCCMRRHTIRLAALLLLALGLMLSTLPARAQSSTLCFKNIPGIGSCISDRFLEYWNQNGGLSVFGYPLTPAFEQRTPEGTFLVQYFERQRFELHPENRRPYDVLLGRLGDEMLRRQGRDWRSEPTNPSDPNCWTAPQTGRSLCDPFMRYWNDQYLRGLSPTDGSLALWGLPLTDARVERNPDGSTVSTQWLERARYEYHPNNPRPYQVLLGRLGAEVLDGTPATIGGISNGHEGGSRQLVIGSERDGSFTVVLYTDATVIRCADNGPLPAKILDRPQVKVSATGTLNRMGMLSASSIVVLCR